MKDLKISNHCQCKKPETSGHWEVTSGGSYSWCQKCGLKYVTKLKVNDNI